MSALLAVLLLLSPQEDDSGRAREAAFGLPGFPRPQAAPAKDPAPQASFMTPRVKRAVEDYRDLLAHNVFSPRKTAKPDPAGKTADGAAKPPEGPRMRTWIVTGIVFNAVDQRYEALVEDTAAKESRYVKTGDAIAGVTISDVTFEQVSILREGAPAVLKLRDALSEKVAGGAAPSAPVKVEEPGDIESIIERLKKRNKREIVPDEVEEEAEAPKKPK